MLQKLNNQDLYFKLKAFVSKSENKEVINLIEECSIEINKADDLISDYQDDIDAFETETWNLNNQIHDLEKKVTDLENQIEDLNIQIKDLENDI